MNTHEQADSSMPQRSLPERNLRLALILASVAAVFFIGFIVKAVMLSHH
jgi:hypothetical protein